MENNTPDFDVVISDLDDNTAVVTTAPIEEIEESAVLAAYGKFKNNPNKGTVLKEESSDKELTIERLKELAASINSDVNALIEANEFIRMYALTDDSIGKAVESIFANVNSSYKISYPKIEGRNKNKKLEEAKKYIEDFNDQIDLQNFIRDAITATYQEGTRIYYMRSNKGNYSVDNYPLGISEVSDWKYGSFPICVINMAKLRDRLRKTYAKRKNKKPLFYKDANEEIKDTFPPEVYKAYVEGDSYAVLDVDRTGCMRILNFGQKYGVSPIFKSLRNAVILDSIENKDIVNNKAKARKIIHQLLRKELMGTDGKFKGITDTMHVHSELMAALQNKTAVYTSPPYVEKIYYVEPTVDDTPAEKIALYRSRILGTLGISFTDSEISNLTISKISVDQLMRVINAIGEQLETVLERWYKIVIKEAGFSEDYAPSIKIIDSEVLEYALKKEICSFLYSTLNCSLETAYGMFDINIDDEKQKRLAENSDGLYEDVFFPRQTSYTLTNDDEQTTGRPRNKNPEDPGKQEKDDIYTDYAR